MRLSLRLLFSITLLAGFAKCDTSGSRADDSSRENNFTTPNKLPNELACMRVGGFCTNSWACDDHFFKKDDGLCKQGPNVE